MHPLAVLTHFISSEAPSTLTIDYVSADNAIKLLYTVAKEHLEIVCGQQNEMRQGLQQICQNLELQLVEVKQAIQDGATTKALQYTEDGSEYLRRQKRKYNGTRETTPIEDTPPIQYLRQKDITTDGHQELLQYVATFRNQKTGKMNWKGCYAQAVKGKITMVTTYMDAESLRTMCAKHKKKTSSHK